MAEHNAEVVPIRDYLDVRLSDRAQALRAEIDAARTSITSAVTNAQRDLDKAEASLSHRLDELGARLDEVRLGAAGHMTKDSFDTFRAQLDDVMADYPSKTEVRATQDTINVALAALNQKVSDFINQQTIRAVGMMTTESFEAYKREQVNNQKDARRANLSAWIAIGIALFGWGLTVVLTVISHSHK